MENRHKIIYLTCDDGPESDFRDKIDFLDSKGIKGIWFCLGEKIKENMDGVVYAIERGHIIANHSFDHPYFSKLTIDEARDQLQRTESLIEEAYFKAGVKQPFKAFRFPFYDLGSNCNTFPPDINDPEVVKLQELLIEMGFTCPDFKGVSYKWYNDLGFNKTVSVECTLDFDDWEIDSDAEDINKAYETVLKRVDRDDPANGFGLHNSESAEILLLHTFVELPYFKGIINKVAEEDVVFRLPD